MQSCPKRDSVGQVRERGQRVRLIKENAVLWGSTVRFEPVIRAASPVVFDPLWSVKEHVTDAAAELAEHFADESGGRKRIYSAIGQLIRDARILGFQDGAKISGRKMTQPWLEGVRQEAEDYSKDISRQIRKTTLDGLNKQSAYATSEDRAKAIAEYEGRRAYFRGLRNALGRSFNKKWITTHADPCHHCTDNEDEGAIQMMSKFGSGHLQPPAHLNCGCILGIYR